MRSRENSEENNTDRQSETLQCDKAETRKHSRVRKW